MLKLTQNVIHILGESGKTWIANLPKTTETLVDHWSLTSLIPISDLTFNYVIKATYNNNQPVVLKIGFDADAIISEKQALAHFDGNASIRLIDYNKKYNALLLQQAIPGTSLKSLYPVNDKFVIDCYVDTMLKLLNKPLPKTHSFPHIRDWLKAIDECRSDLLPKHLLEKAIYLKNTLLASMKTEVLLHGDLHHDNILKNGNTWLTIDPKGVVGEPEFDVAAFDFIHNSELTNDLDIKKLLLARIELIAKESNLSVERIEHWVFVRLVLSIAWSVEDNTDSSLAIKLAKLLMPQN